MAEPRDDDRGMADTARAGHAAPGRVLVIQLRRLGDVLLTTALLEDLSRAYPAAELDFLLEPAAASLLAGHALISERIVYEGTAVGMWRAVRRRHYDWVIDVQSNPRTAMLTRASGAPVRAGFRSAGWSWVYTHPVPRAREPTYVLRDRRRLLQRIGVAVSGASPRLFLTEEERVRGESLVAAAGAPPGAPRVGLVLSTADPSRSWKVEGFTAVARALASRGVAAIIFRMPGDDALIAELLGGAPDARVVDVPDLRDFLSALATCDAFLSANTGPAHMATALGVPRVTVYTWGRSSNPMSWMPEVANAVAVRIHRSETAAGGRGSRREGKPTPADKSPRAMTATVDEVVNHLLRLLRGEPVARGVV
ncbi:MAG: glycosyltransferase family 9 protein [Gemmatimonadaceae bacterium]